MVRGGHLGFGLTEAMSALDLFQHLMLVQRLVKSAIRGKVIVRTVSKYS